MKNVTLLKTILLLPFFVCIYIFAQVATPLIKKTTAISTFGTATTLIKHSPDFGHVHDGDFCFASHLTNDWIQKAGIEDKYRAEEAYQNNLVNHISGSDRASFSIPVIFHVIYNAPLENVSEMALIELLNSVNEDFSATNSDIGDARTALGFIPANADITFCLAKQDPSGTPLAEPGIHRVPTVEVWYNPDTETNKMKGSLGGDTGTEGWDRNRYLNVWVCNITNGLDYGVAGYAYKPTIFSLPPADIDGIVIDFNLGVDPSYRVLTHEIGHFLGLDHTWGSSSGSCLTDDGLADTPNTAGPSFDFVNSCSGLQKTCPGVNTQYENFMDYSNCTVMYTDDQVDLMHLVLEGSRVALTSSDVCTSPLAEPPVANFTADITSVIVGGTVNFADLSTNLPTNWNWTITPMTGVSYVGGTSAISQDPIVKFDNEGLFTIALKATNGEGSDTETKTNYIEVVLGGDGESACDTLRNYTKKEYKNVSIYTLDGESGYYPAQVTLGDGAFLVEGYAEPFTAPEPTFVKQIRLPIFQADDIGGASNVTFHVWTDAGGEPGFVVGTEIVAINDLEAGYFNIIDFSTPVPVSGNYWVGIKYDYSAGFDTVSLGTTRFSDRPSGPSTTSMFISDDIGWVLSSDIFGGEPNSSLILDVLTSNGGSPIPVVSLPITETCAGMEVTMNGFGSINTTNYFWQITDGVDAYGSNEANLTTELDAGIWTVKLIADGACESVSSPTYTLTINPAITAVVKTVAENCSDENGSIKFTASGGDGGPFEYSINGGAIFLPTSLFTDLSSGTYNYIVKDEHNCNKEGVAVVANVNSFAPSISPDIIITPGSSTNLTVTGGVTWSWYDGIDFMGSTATITVSPAVTTTYICNVVAADGCDAVLEVTVFIDGGSEVKSISLEEGVELYPNPASDFIHIALKLTNDDKVDFSVMNVLGEVVYHSNVSTKDKVITLDVTDFSKGVYFISIQTEHDSVTKKVVVE